MMIFQAINLFNKCKASLSSTDEKTMQSPWLVKVSYIFAINPNNWSAWASKLGITNSQTSIYAS